MDTRGRDDQFYWSYYSSQKNCQVGGSDASHLYFEKVSFTRPSSEQEGLPKEDEAFWSLVLWRQVPHRVQAHPRHGAEPRQPVVFFPVNTQTRHGRPG